MNPTLASTETVCWQSRDGKHALECPPALLEQMRAAAVEGLNRLGHGGVEIGGVLYGTREEGVIRVLAARAVDCEYAAGPAFVLSGADARAFGAALEAASSDPELAGMQAVGWYHSHTRSGTELTPADLQFHGAHFPKPWQAAVVLRPSNFGPTTAGVFFVNGAGDVQGDPEAWEIRGSRTRRAQAPPRVEAPEVRPSSPPAAGPTRSRDRRLMAAAGVLLLAMVVLLWSHRETTVALHVTDTGGQLRIQWDRSAPAVRSAQTGRLEIQDGNSRVQIALGPDQLRHGNVVYERRAGSVLVRLVLEREGAPSLETLTQYVGADPPPERAPQTPRVTAPVREISAESALAVPVIENVKEAPPRPAADPAPSPRRFAAPPARPAAPSDAMLLPSPPRIAPGPEGALAPLITVPEPMLPARRAADRSVRSGALLWTGELRRHAVVEIDGASASAGYLNGSLPAAPVRVAVLPARLSSAGLLVYSRGTRRGTEPPSAANGWNRTTYLENADLARGITLLEAPGPQNGWKRLVFRCESRSCGLVMIRWEAR